MLERQGDLFQQYDANAICLTTNGFVKKNHACVMGRGVAATAKNAWPGVEWTLGERIEIMGNCVHLLTEEGESAIILKTWKGDHWVPYHILSFPVKPAETVATQSKNNVVSRYRTQIDPGETVPGWMATAELDLIVKSARRLVALTDHYGWKNVSLPQPGCGNGELNWTREVQPVLSSIFDDRFVVCYL